LCICITVPEGVSVPSAVAVGPTFLVLQWQLPTSPNGVFTGFKLLQSSSVVIYSGALTEFNVTNLTVRIAAALFSLPCIRLDFRLISHLLRMVTHLSPPVKLGNNTDFVIGQ